MIRITKMQYIIILNSEYLSINKSDNLNNLSK